MIMPECVIASLHHQFFACDLRIPEILSCKESSKGKGSVLAALQNRNLAEAPLCDFGVPMSNVHANVHA